MFEKCCHQPDLESWISQHVPVLMGAAAVSAELQLS